MLKYLLKRLLLFCPTILAITFLTFFLSVLVPGGPEMQFLQEESNNFGPSVEKDYQKIRNRLGLDKPLFYFSFSSSAALPGSSHISPRHFENFERISYNFGNPGKTVAYHEKVQVLSLLNSGGQSIEKGSLLQELFQKNEKTGISGTLARLEDYYLPGNPGFSEFQEVRKTFAELQAEERKYLKYFPAFTWNGPDNRYHCWLFGDAPWFVESNGKYKSKGILRGDFGHSFHSALPVSSQVWNAVKWTSVVSLLSILLAYVIAIPLGVFASMPAAKKYNKISNPMLFVLYSLPDFWVAVMLVIFLGGGDYLSLFPPTVLMSVNPAQPFWSGFIENLWHLVLPVVCLSYSSLAFIVLQLKKAMENNLSRDFILAAKARGISNPKIFWSHALKNSLLPMITLFAGILPTVVSGAFIIENIFSIPGMGKLSFYALTNRDYPVVFAVVFLSSLMVLLGYFLADIFYFLADPRVKINQGNSK